jgi:hypothetical protein
MMIAQALITTFGVFFGSKSFFVQNADKALS